MQKLLLCSSSKAGDSDYLAPVIPWLCERVPAPATIAFVPFAGVTMSYAEYTQRVAEKLAPLGYDIINLAAQDDAVATLVAVDAILVGGGNTFHLLNELQQRGLVTPLQSTVQAGTPYIGWSAGSNIAGLSIRTTNDMPIVEPQSFSALSFLPCQLNPHYIDSHPPGFHGETRDQRLAEFTTVAPSTAVIGLREGSALWVDGDTVKLCGDAPGVLFLGNDKHQLPANSDISAWLSSK
ncbi:hypothetical protein IDAT_00860 [Pseudidiomarina atlantica]|uniref:Peptidase E n=1 Tax=Pseudidiomarina atlantica TaxID=1517416 RepID=A0A094IRC7_9GAMM|nr:dipeptidase PepE [Pseudidiomarina atlantica]KFZ29687.1 hypothetical protein IDAT_00860 [Pseudidiomarina atlantica]